MTDLRKSGLDLLYELIEEVNPGFTAKFPKGSLVFGTPSSSSVGGGFTNTRIPIRSGAGGTAVGSGYVYYRRIDPAKLFRGMSLSVTAYRSDNRLPKADYLALLNRKYGINLQPSDTPAGDHPGPGQNASISMAPGNLCYQGTLTFMWNLGKRPLEDLVTADKRTLSGRVFPAGLSSYADFLTWIKVGYPTTRPTTDIALTTSNTTGGGFGADCYDTGQPVYGSPVEGWVRYDSNVSGLIRMLVGSKEVADDLMTNHRRIGISYGQAANQTGFTGVSRNGYTSQAAGAGSGVQITEIYYWDEVNRRPMRWKDPGLVGTKAFAFKTRQPVENERPRGELIGYGGDYSKWAPKLSSSITWQELADAMKEITGLPFTTDSYMVPYGIVVPTDNFLQYTLPSTAVPGANSAKFNRVVVMTQPGYASWFTGNLYLHYNV